PAALFMVDIGHEHIALAEARRLGITTFGMVDTNCDPNKVEFSIPANDDATKSIAIVTNYIVAAIAEGLAERQAQKDDEPTETQDDTENSAAKFEVGSDEDRERRRRGQSGGGRGSGGPGGAGGGAPRRRTTGGPGGGGNRPGGPGGRR
ncbi:MAG TPA: 30S ribosomal protein S2, partial [Chitinophagaceae bacterium]|nr:30S ribosomal protein S2 [Chitinophagaceae bacterium]